MLFHLKSVLTRKSEIPKKIPIFRTVFRNFRYWVHPYPGVKIYIFGLHRFKLVQKYHFYHCCILWVFKSTVILLCIAFWVPKSQVLFETQIAFKIIFSHSEEKGFAMRAHCLKITQNVAFEFLNFCPIKTDLSGNTVWPQTSVFQKLAKMDHFWHF